MLMSTINTKRLKVAGGTSQTYLTQSALSIGLCEIGVRSTLCDVLLWSQNANRIARRKGGS